MGSEWLLWEEVVTLRDSSCSGCRTDPGGGRLVAGSEECRERCDVIKSVSGLCPLFLVQSFKNPWHFLSDRVVIIREQTWVHADEVIHVNPWIVWGGVVSPGSPSWD